jgi:hypothetical protein
MTIDAPTYAKTFPANGSNCLRTWGTQQFLTIKIFSNGSSLDFLLLIRTCNFSSFC